MKQEIVTYIQTYIQLIISVGSIIGIGSIYTLWKKYISPRFFRVKLKKLYFLIQEWFDTIDVSDISDLRMNLLGNKEKKISQFIKDQNIEYRKIIIRPKHRRKFLRFCGIQDKYCEDKKIFERFSRIHAEGVNVLQYWIMLSSSFVNFKKNYENKSPETNFANIEMPIKFLKQYLHIKVEGSLHQQP